MAEAHERDLNLLMEQARAEQARQRDSLKEDLERIGKTMQNDNKNKGLSLKDLKPDKFESNKKSKQSFK